MSEIINDIKGMYGRLKVWFYIYLALWLAGMFGRHLITKRLTFVLLIGLIPYIVSIVYSYKIQRKLNQARLYKHEAWQVIVGALILNPFFIGFLIPLSVLYVTRKRIVDPAIPTDPYEDSVPD